jgi:SAM-dependent methyltransferase
VTGPRQPPPFANLFGPQAERYAKVRPHYPPALFHYLAVMARTPRLAWDCGTGTGQAAIGLAERFARVEATDPSAEMIAQAPPHARVHYRVAQYDSGLPDASVNLVTVAQALHWFDLGPFFSEVRRVLAPDGVFAAWCYALCRVEPRVNEVLDQFYRVTLGPFWPAERRHVDDGYRTLALPIDESVPPPIEMSHDWTLLEFLAYVRSWSGVTAFIAARGEEPILAFEETMRRTWGNAVVRRRVVWPLSFRIGHLRRDP